MKNPIDHLRSVVAELNEYRDAITSDMETVEAGPPPELAAGYRLIARDIGAAAATANALLEIIELDASA